MALAPGSRICCDRRTETWLLMNCNWMKTILHYFHRLEKSLIRALNVTADLRYPEAVVMEQSNPRGNILYHFSTMKAGGKGLSETVYGYRNDLNLCHGSAELLQAFLKIGSSRSQSCTEFCI